MRVLSTSPVDGSTPDPSPALWGWAPIVALVLLTFTAALVVADSNDTTNATNATNATSSGPGAPGATVLGLIVTVIGAGLRAAWGRWQNAHETTDFRQVGLTLAIGFISGVVLAALTATGEPTLVLYATNPAVALLVGVVATDLVEAVLKGTLRRLPGDIARDAGPLLLTLLKKSKPAPPPPPAPPDPDVEAVVGESDKPPGAPPA